MTRIQSASILLLSLAACDLLHKKDQVAPEPASATSVAAPATAVVAPATAVAAPATAVAALPIPVAPASAAAPALSAPAPAAPIPVQVANELGQVGVSTTPQGFQLLGTAKGRLLSAAGNLATRTTSLGFLFNNDDVVNALVARPDIRTDCHDEAALRSVLEYALGTNTAQQLLASPAAVSSLVGSKLFATIRNCPAFKQLAADPDTLSRLVADRPSLDSVLSQPNFRAGLGQARIKQNPPAPPPPAVAPGTACCSALRQSALTAAGPGKGSFRAAAQICQRLAGNGQTGPAVLAAVRNVLGAAPLPAACN